MMMKFNAYWLARYPVCILFWSGYRTSFKNVKSTDSGEVITEYKMASTLLSLLTIVSQSARTL